MVVITREGIIEDIRTEVYGCGYSIAGASFFNEYAKGKKVSDVVEYMQSRVKDMLIDVPETNRNCISLPLKAFEIIRGEYNKHE